MGLSRMLTVASLIETASLPILLVNRLTGHWPVITSSVGPLHGICYLTVIAVALATTSPIRRKALALIPAVGGVLFIAAHRRTNVPSSGCGDTPAPRDGDPGPIQHH